MARTPVIAIAFLLAGCASAPASEPSLPPVAAPDGSHAAAASPPAPVDFVLVDKSDRMLTAYAGGVEVRRFTGLQFGDAPIGHKRFEGDERTPEGRYRLDYRNPQSAYRLSLHISYPNSADREFAQMRGKSPGGDIFIHGQPNGLAGGRIEGDWTDGCIALSNTEIEELWRLVPDGTAIEIRP